MKMKTLSVLAGVSAPLIATAGAEAGLVSVFAVGKDNPFGYFVCNVYAEFDNAGNDYMQAVAGTPNAAMNITVVGGGVFFNHPSGGDTAPTQYDIDNNPKVAFDSFYTIGKKVVATDAYGFPTESDFTTLVNMPTLTGTGQISTTNGSWAIVPPTEGQGNPFDSVNAFPGNGTILIGQFTFAPLQSPNAIGIVGSFLMQYESDGVITASVEGFEHFIPTPGALGLLGAAGLIGRRRRRR